jgi:hypothetical protein
MGFAMMFYMGLTGCQKDETVSKNEITTTLPPQLAKGEDGPDKHELRCQCEYQVVLVTSSTPPTGYGLTYQTITNEKCVTNPDCTYFGYAESCADYYFNSCLDIIPLGTPHPTPWYPFECMVETTSKISPFIHDASFVNYISMPTPGNTCGSPHATEPAGYAIIKIRCKDACEP